MSGFHLLLLFIWEQNKGITLLVISQEFKRDVSIQKVSESWINLQVMQWVGLALSQMFISVCKSKGTSQNLDHSCSIWNIPLENRVHSLKEHSMGMPDIPSVQMERSVWEHQAFPNRTPVCSHQYYQWNIPSGLSFVMRCSQGDGNI